MNNYDYRKIQFGKADAKKESANYPNLLVDGYIDIDDVVDKALYSDIFLFLGYKGSGKSALSEHLKLKYHGPDCLVDQIMLHDFPYRSFAKKVAEDDSLETRTSHAWRWLLLARVFSNILSDSAAVSDRIIEAHDLSKILKQYGLFPIKEIGDFAKKSTTSTFQLVIAQYLSAGYSAHKELDKDIPYIAITDYLREILSSFSVASKQLIIIDGLDDILSGDSSQYVAIGTLIAEVDKLNIFFSDSNLPIKFIILCRTDLLGRTNNPNKNKIVQDSSYSFDWFDEQIISPSDSSLFQIAQKRVNLVYPEITNFWDTFFPSEFRFKDLLIHTRYTPRDFLQLLSKIKSACTHPGIIEVKRINQGITDYSKTYFLPEIKDELVGYLKPDKIDELFTIFSSLSGPIVSYDQLLDSAGIMTSITSDELFSACRILYDCGAIGNTYVRQRKRVYTYKYIHRASSFAPKLDIVLHKGLRKALNIRFDY